MRRAPALRPVRAPPFLLYAALLALLVVALPAVLYAHVQLQSSTPSRDEVLSEAPSHLRLLFSGRIEAPYTSVTLTAPDGSTVPLGDIVFVRDSDREFMAAVPPLTAAGIYVVRWRTAGADGHVLEGSWAFTLLPDTARAVEPWEVPAQPPIVVHEHEQHEHEVEHSGADAAPVLARWLHFLSLVLLLGAVAFRVLLWPRLAVSEAAARAMQRRAWITLALAALLLVISAVLRLWLQSVALHGAGLAWDGELLSTMLRETTWGRAWLVQTFFLALLGAGIAWAAPPRDRAGLRITVLAAIGLATVPALSGHAAGATVPYLPIVVDTLHVVGVGVWLGGLALVLLVMMPAMARHEAAPALAIGAGVARYSPIALGAAVLVLATGLINALMHIGSVAQLWETNYGRALLLKLALLVFVAGAGFYNWRVLRPRLATGADPRLLRISAGVELTAAALVLLATALLTGLPRP